MLRGLGNLSQGEPCFCPAGLGWPRIVKGHELDLEALK